MTFAWKPKGHGGASYEIILGLRPDRAKALRQRFIGVLTEKGSKGY